MDQPDWYADGQATLGDRLAAAREAAGMTPAQAAARLGVRGKTLADWEDDSAEPRANRLQMLAALYGVSLRWLLTGQGEGAPEPLPEGAGAEALRAALADVRALRADLARSQERLGRVEKALARLHLAGAADG
jgi:transcriptional regulator with XRE-family HTH domain